MVRVEVKLVDGTHLERTVAAGRGNENAFASEAEVVAKFMKLATTALPGAQVAQLADWILRLDEKPDVRELAKLLVPA